MPVELVEEEILTSFHNKFQLLKKKLENSEKLGNLFACVFINLITVPSDMITLIENEILLADCS